MRITPDLVKKKKEKKKEQKKKNMIGD